MGLSSSKVTPLALSWTKWNQDLKKVASRCFCFGYWKNGKVSIPSPPTFLPQSDDEWNQAMDGLTIALRLKSKNKIDSASMDKVMQVMDLLFWGDEK